MTDSQDFDIDTGVIAGKVKALAAQMPLHLLLVDDDEIERTLITDRLERYGFVVSQASDGEAALAELSKRDFPVMIVDWTMPVMDGIAFTEAVRTRGIKDAYIVMLTAKDGEFDVERGYEAGVDDYLSKKVREAELLARINTAFSTYALRREVAELRARVRALQAAG